mmetsp:Transcript_11917/g.20237  ORF Transcript_11917/g.20237 Transcript_11917/m.20237 type:complete len:256 (+) Transcript_11917:1811-2578(+)
MLESIHYISFGATRLRVVIILPSRSLWQTHQNTLNSTTGLEAEHCSTIIDKVELHISSTTHELPLLLLFCEWIIFMCFNNRTIGGHDRVDGILGKFEQFFWLTIIQVIEEDTTKSTSFITVRNNKVLIGPRFEFGVEFWIVTITDLLVCSMEMPHIIFIEVCRSNIGSTSKPPNTSISLKVTVVEMHGRTMRIAWVHHTGKPTSKEGNTFPRCHTLGPIHTTFGSRLQCLLGHGSIHHGKIDTCLFKHGTIFEYT